MYTPFSHLSLTSSKRAGLRLTRSRVNRSTQLGGGQDGRIVARAPPQQRQVVANRLGQVAGVAQLAHRRRSVTLGELAPVGPVQQGQVGVDGQRRVRADAHGFGRLQHQHLLGRVRDVVLAAHDVRDASVEIVDRDREVVENRSIGTRDHGVVEMGVLEAGLAADRVLDDRRALDGHAQAHGARRLGLSPEPVLGAVQLLVGPHVIRGGARAVGVARFEQGLEHLPMTP